MRGIFTVFLGGMLLVGCAKDISSSTYEVETVGSSTRTYACEVVKVRRVKVKDDRNGYGSLVGAVTGGVLGAQIGGGNARYVTGALGALAGGAAGSKVEQSLRSQEGYEYVVRLESGQMQTVVQGLENPLSVGQAALLMVDFWGKGRSRVVAR